MLASFAPPLLLLASAVAAQVQTPSVVTFQSVIPVPTTEGVFTIQTSVPAVSTSACYEVCIQAPCAPCGVTSSDGSMGIPPGETPIPNPLRSSASTSTSVTGSAPLLSNTSQGSRVLPSPSSSGSAPPQQSTSAASPVLLRGGRTLIQLALAVSTLVLMGAAFVL